MAHRGRENADPVLIVSLAAGLTVQDAARAAGVGERTVYRRLEDEAFQQRVREARDALIARAVGKLADAATEATDTLRSLLDAATPPAVRLGAARSILELTMKLQEHTDHAERIAALERGLAAGSAPASGGKAWAG